MIGALVVCLFANLVLAAPRDLVTDIDLIDEDNLGFRLKPIDNGYELFIRQNDATRTETVEEISPGELLVKGQQYIDYNNNRQLLVNYEAGRNGYIASYRYQIPTRTTTEPPALALAPPALLKSLTG